MEKQTMNVPEIEDAINLILTAKTTEDLEQLRFDFIGIKDHYKTFEQEKFKDYFILRFKVLYDLEKKRCNLRIH